MRRIRIRGYAVAAIAALGVACSQSLAPGTDPNEIQASPDEVRRQELGALFLNWLCAKQASDARQLVEFNVVPEAGDTWVIRDLSFPNPQAREPGYPDRLHSSVTFRYSEQRQEWMADGPGAERVTATIRSQSWCH